jgi:hypothetical protein
MTVEPAEPTSAPPALFDHCCKTYKAMLAEARTVIPVAQVEEEHDELSTSESQHIIVYEGFFTQLVTGKLNLSVPYYTSIRQALVRMGCIRQLKRGGGTSPSQWELIYEPTLEAFMNATPKKKTAAQDKEALVQEQLDSINGRLTDVEDKVDGILESLADFFGKQPVTPTEGEE